VAAVLANGTLTCASAAPFHGMWRLHEPERLHLLCAHGSASGAVVHRASLVPTEFPQPVASLTDTLLHALRCLPPVDAAVMVESALLQGRTTLDYLRQRLPGNRNGAARAVLDLVDGTADSAIEVVARLLFRNQGIYTQTQVNLPGIGFVDFLLEGFLIVEIDGSTHLERTQVKKDRGGTTPAPWPATPSSGTRITTSSTTRKRSSMRCGRCYAAASSAEFPQV
jgi:hypothetical protein